MKLGPSRYCTSTYGTWRSDDDDDDADSFVLPSDGVGR